MRMRSFVCVEREKRNTKWPACCCCRIGGAERQRTLRSVYLPYVRGLVSVRLVGVFRCSLVLLCCLLMIDATYVSEHRFFFFFCFSLAFERRGRAGWLYLYF